METIIGTIIGAVVAGAAMLLNSHFSAKRQEQREDHIARRKQLEKDIDALNQLYEDSLHSLDRIIRMYGSDKQEQLEKIYNLEIKLQLNSTQEIYNKFKEIKSDVANLADKLTSLPKEFIPKFESDEHRLERLENRKEAEEKREQEAAEYLPAIYSKHKELAALLKNDLENRKKLTL